MEGKTNRKREYRTDEEIRFHNAIKALLKDDGMGHHYPKFAERLDDFDIKLVPATGPGSDPNLAAAINPQTGVIYVNAGFLNWGKKKEPKPGEKREKFPALFRQLSVLIRHELAHYFLAHEIKMINKLEKKYGKTGGMRMRLGQSLPKLLNIIEDFEISNRLYSEEDKQTVEHIWLNGQLFPGLVTEHVKKGWETMNVIEMYEELSKEIESFNAELLKNLAETGTPTATINNDFVKGNIAQAHLYTATIGKPANFIGLPADGRTPNVLDIFINNKALYHFFPYDSVDGNGNSLPCLIKFSSLPDEWQTMFKSVANFIQSSAVDGNYLKKTLKELERSSPMAPYNLVSPETGEIIETIYSPEEKLLVLDAIKAILPEKESYATWYNKIKQVLSDPKYSKKDLQDILDVLQ